MVEVGQVIEIKKDKAVVRFSRKTSCDKCGMCAFKKDDMFVKCTLLNSLNARVGDSVKVHMGKGYVLTAAVIVYLIPLLLAGIALLATFAFKEYIQFIAVAVALVAGFTAAAIIDKRVIAKKKGFRPTMVEIININDGGNTDNE